MSREGDATHTAPPTPDLVRRAPGFLARRLHQAYTAAWGRHVDAVLTGPQYSVLATIAEHPAADQGSLAASVALDRSTMADVCRRLEQRGLIERATAPSDGRRKLLDLTASGRDTLDAVTERVRRLDDRLLAQHPDAVALLDELATLAATWEATVEVPPPP